jgi:hypothetical protein
MKDLFYCSLSRSYFSARRNQPVSKFWQEQNPAADFNDKNLVEWLYPSGFLSEEDNLPLLLHFHDRQYSWQMAELAKIAHRGQTRDAGEPYITHPARIASRVRLHPIASEITLSVAWGHDCDEDTLLKCKWIERHFPGTPIAMHIGELTNVSKADHPRANRAARKQMDREKISKASRESKIIKMFDRIDNIADMRGKPQDFVDLYCKESFALAKVLRDADPELNDELLETIEATRQRSQRYSLSLKEMQVLRNAVEFHRLATGEDIVGALMRRGSHVNMNLQDGELVELARKLEQIDPVGGEVYFNGIGG